MEGNLVTEDDPSSETTRRRVLKASAALSATGVVTGSGFVGSAAGGHEPCPRSVQCDAGIDFRSQEVGDACGHGTCAGTVNDSVIVRSVNVTCDTGGWIDLHDKSRTVGPSGTFGAGYPVGHSTFLQQGTHRSVCINLYEDCGTCALEWDRNNWPSDTAPQECRSMGAMLHLDDPSDTLFTHYCNHAGPGTADDHAYLCPTGDPVNDVAVVCGDGSM